MKIDIWSDVMCPFCYIGKRKLEGALSKFEHRDKVEIEWHSFQLDPSLVTQPGVSVYDYLAKRKGFTRARSEQLHAQVTQTAKEAGLEYNFDKTIIANSFDAHRLVQLAKTHGKGDAAEEVLFRAYFTEGKNIDDEETLVNLGEHIGLGKDEILETLYADAFAEDVANDQAKAAALGVTGVPFFVFNNKYAISGAQPVETFLETLDQTWKEKAVEQEAGNVAACTIEGNC